MTRESIKPISLAAASGLKRGESGGAVLRVGAQGPLQFAGVVARNPAMRRLLREGHAGQLITVADPQLVGALGAALHGLAGGP